ncbi:MAG: sulfatase family protein [Planctomycetota bacterium]|jgi:arylsulfatase A-like enzyme
MLALCSIAALALLAPGVADDPPDVLLITIDTLRADSLGCYGREEARTETLDRLAAEGVRFEHAFAPRGVTLPSLTTVLTGVSPLSHGVLGNGFNVPKNVTTVAELLKARGYETSAFVTNQCTTIVDMADHVGRGFDTRHCAKRTSDLQYEWDEEATESALAWLDRPKQGPAFTWVHYMSPHGQHQPRPELYRDGEIPEWSHSHGELFAMWETQNVSPPPEKMEELWKLYDAEIEGVDLDIAVVAGDHGEEFFQHNNFRGHGDSIYDHVLRVPMIVNAPGRIPPGMVSPRFAELQDITPTILDLLDVEHDVAFEGRSLLPLLDPDSEPVEDVAFGTWFRDIVTVRTPRYRYVFNRSPGQKPAHAHRARFDFFNRQEMLFDLKNDPLELHDLLADPETADLPAVVEARTVLRQKIQDWHKSRQHIEPVEDAGVIMDPAILEELEALGYLGDDGAVDDGTSGRRPESDPDDG